MVMVMVDSFEGPSMQKMGGGGGQRREVALMRALRLKKEELLKINTTPMQNRQGTGRTVSHGSTA
jgi:hypothetical protein